MKKTLLFLGFILTFAFLYAQTNNHYMGEDDGYAVPKHTSAQIASSSKEGGIILWDNSNINEEGTLVTTYWAGNDNWAWCADDFEADGPWIIQKVYTKGYNKDNGNLPEKMVIVFWADDNGKPGTQLYRDDNIAVALPLDTFPEIVLPQPYTLPGAGKYWITIAGRFETIVQANGDIAPNRWDIRRGATPKGSSMHIWDKLSVFGLPGEWTDASLPPVASSPSMYFKIEGDPNVPIDCEPPTNLTVNYGNACSTAELKWTAPGEGEFTYQVFRDDEVIATVETESYSDLTFEPTLVHTWGVKVVCEGYTTMTIAIKDACKEPDCPQRPKNLAIDLDCEANSAKMTWLPTNDVLWDNAPVSTNSGFMSYRCLLEQYSRTVIYADDFLVPAGETWYIKEIYFAGFYAASGQTASDPPDYIGIEIFEDSGAGIPGTQIYENISLTPLSGNMGSTSYLVLPEPFEIIAPGRYWLSIYGVHESLSSEIKRYWVYTIVGTDIEYPPCYWAEEDGPDAWATNPGYSIYFRVLGDKIIATKTYNIYRDGIAIATGVTDLFYEDKDFSLYSAHTWAVKYACPGGGESAPAYLSFPKCKEGPDPGVMENETTSFTIAPNPSSTQITITLENNAVINSIEVVNFLGQTVVSKTNLNKMETTLDVSNLNNGIYFVRVVSNNGPSVQKFIKQ